MVDYNIDHFNAYCNPTGNISLFFTSRTGADFPFGFKPFNRGILKSDTIWDHDLGQVNYIDKQHVIVYKLPILNIVKIMHT